MNAQGYLPFGLKSALRTVVCAALSAVMTGCAGLPPANEAGSMDFEGKPIDPLCLQLLGGSIADSKPIVTSIDLQAFSHSNSRAESVHRNADMVTCRDGEGNDVGYHVIGCAPDSVIAVLLSYSTGGSATFSWVLFLRRTDEWTVENEKKRLRPLLVCVVMFEDSIKANSQIKLVGQKLYLGDAGPAQKVMDIP